MLVYINQSKWILHYAILLLLFAVPNCFAVNNEKDSELDPIIFKFYANKSEVAVGEEFELTIVAVKQKGWNSRFNQTFLTDNYRIKVVFPDEFEQTSGNYSHFIYGKIVKDLDQIEYKIIGRYNSEPAIDSQFTLLRGTENSVELNRYLYKAHVLMPVIGAANRSQNAGNNKRTLNSKCSYEEGQYIATFEVTSERVYAHYCGSTLYATTSPNGDGYFKPGSWLRAIGYNNYDCFSNVEPNSANCNSSCITPSAPVITKTAGTTVCLMNNQSVTLTAKGAGTIKWFKDGIHVGTGNTLKTTDVGNYSATSTVDNCVSDGSSTIAVAGSSECGSADKRPVTSSSTCMGYTFTDRQVIGSVWQGKMEVRIESNCAVVYWADDALAKGRAHENWLVNLTGKTIPDRVLKSCLKWDGDPLDCAGSTCESPAAPTIKKTSGNTVCPLTNESVTLTASGSGNITWFKDNVEVGTGTTYVTNSSGIYTATASSGDCESEASSKIEVTRSTVCGLSSCRTPDAPIITKTIGTTVCGIKNQSVTLSASGTGTITWFKDNVQVGTGITYQTTVEGNYTATATSGSCVSAASSPVVLAVSSDCQVVEDRPSSGNFTCSGYTFTDHQVIGSVWQGNVEVRLEGNCAVVYWADGGLVTGRTHENWLANLSGKTIPDEVLKSCLKWSGKPLDCGGEVACTTPAVPKITMTEGSAVCNVKNQSVTLSASGSGTITWFKYNTQVGIGSTYITAEAGIYTATATDGSCISPVSSPMVVTMSNDCNVVEQKPVTNTITCSGYTFTHKQIIGKVWQGNVEIRIEGNCPVAYWADDAQPSGRTNQNWLANLTGKTIPDAVLQSCVKWSGDPIECEGSCTAPTAPTIVKTEGTTVCSENGQSVTLTASGCTGFITWYRAGFEVGTGNTFKTDNAGSYTATCTSGTCASVFSNAIVVTETSNCGVVVNSDVIGTYTKKVANREYTYNRTPVLELQFNADGTISDATPGLYFDGTTNKVGNKRVFYMIGYSVFGDTRADGSKAYNTFQNVHLPDGIYSIRQFLVDQNLCANIKEFTEKLTGWNNGVNTKNSQLSEINLSIKSSNGGETNIPSWLKVSRAQLLSKGGLNQKADGTFSAYNIKTGVQPSDYQAIGVNTELQLSGSVQPNTWKVFKWPVDYAKPTKNELYENGRTIAKLYGINANTVVSDEYPENTQNQDPDIDLKMHEFYRGVLDHIKLSNPGINKNQTNLYGSYGRDDFNKLISKEALGYSRKIFEESLTTNVHKKLEPSTMQWTDDAEYYSAGDIDVRNINFGYYMYNDVRMIPYELCYMNERVKIGTKTYQNKDRESKWIALTWGYSETLVRDHNGEAVGIELARTGDIIPYSNGELSVRYNAPIAGVWEEYFPLGFYSTWLGDGIALWGGDVVGEDINKIHFPSNENQPIKWTPNGGKQEDYVPGRNKAPANHKSGLISTLNTSPVDAAYAGWKLAKSIKGRSHTISHSSYTSSIGSFQAIPGDAGLHLNGFGELNKNLFVVKDSYDQQKGLALVGQGPEGNVAVYYNGFLSQHEFEDNVVVNFGGQSVNLGRVYGRQIATKNF